MVVAWFCIKHETAYEVRVGDWSSDVCSSDLLFIVARARIESAESKLLQAGADRVVNPQHIGGQRIAAMILQPSVPDFLDVVMHDADIEFRLAKVQVGEGSAIAAPTQGAAHIRTPPGPPAPPLLHPRSPFPTPPPPPPE